MRFRLRTLLIVAALGPPAIAAAWFLTKNPNVLIIGSIAMTVVLIAIIFTPAWVDP
jgi:hypothetical protein